MSLQTSIARGALDAAQGAERGHLRGCNACSMAAARRRPAERCRRGRELREQTADAAEALRAEQAADAAPAEGQAALW